MELVPVQIESLFTEKVSLGMAFTTTLCIDCVEEQPPWPVAAQVLLGDRADRRDRVLEDDRVALTRGHVRQSACR